MRKYVRNLATESIAIHKQVATSLTCVSECTHNGRVETECVCTPCVNRLSVNFKGIALQNEVAGKYVQRIIRNGQRSPLFSRRSSKAMDVLLERRICEFETYLYNLACKRDCSAIKYWRKYSHSHPEKI